jgi:cation transport ATPase
MSEDLESTVASEPVNPADETERPRTELEDLTRRFWVGLALSLPVFILSAREAFGARYFEPIRFYGNYSIQAALSGVVIFWAGGPIFWRLGNPTPLANATNFNLARAGIAGAWLFSVAGVAFFPMLGRHTIDPVPVFFDSAVLVTLLALRVQVSKTKLIVKVNLQNPATSDPLAPPAQISAFRSSQFPIPNSQFLSRYEATVIAIAVLTLALWLCFGTYPSLMQAPEKAAARAIAAAVAVLIAASPVAMYLTESLSNQEVPRRNHRFAIIHSAITIPIVAGLFCPLFGLRLTPMFAGLAMALGSLIILRKTRRLRRA